MAKGENSYRNILKGASVFGGVQIIQILVGLLRGKFVAVILGPAGMGVSALFTSTLNLMQQLSSLGLNLAIVKEVARVKDSPDALAQVGEVARRLVYFTALFGALLCVGLSGLLSEISFGDTSMSGWMMVLGAVVFLTVAWQGEMSILQGLHKVKLLSRASIVGALTGLLAGVPLYYFFGTSGIVPAMMVYAAVMLLFYVMALRHTIGRRAAGFLWRENLPMVKRLLSMGLVLMSVMVATNLSQYLLNAWVRSMSNLTDVGLWQAANSLTMQYAQVVFMGMGMDYLPRLSACINTGTRFHTVVNRQTEIVTLAMGPLAALLILFAPLVVHLLLDTAFEAAVPLLRVMCVALAARATMYPLGFVTLAKDNKKVYFWMEAIGCNVLTLALSGFGFMYFGLIGIGYAMVADCLLCLIIYWIVNRSLYGFRFNRGSLFGICFSLIIAGVTLIGAMLDDSYLGTGIMVAAVVVGLIIATRRIRCLLRADSPG